MIRTEPLELLDGAGLGTGRYRMVRWSDERPADGMAPLCECGGASHESPATAGHETPVAAVACPVVRGWLDRVTATPRSPAPTGGAAVVLSEPRHSYGSDGEGGIYFAVDEAPSVRLTRQELRAMLAEADRGAPLETPAESGR